MSNIYSSFVAGWLTLLVLTLAYFLVFGLAALVFELNLATGWLAGTIMLSVMALGMGMVLASFAASISVQLERPLSNRGLAGLLLLLYLVLLFLGALIVFNSDNSDRWLMLAGQAVGLLLIALPFVPLLRWIYRRTGVMMPD